MCTRFHLQSRQRLEDFSSPIIEQHNTQITPQMIAPQCIHVIEETQVAYKDKVQLIGCPRIPQSRRERPLYAARSPVATHLHTIRNLEKLRIADRRAIRQMQHRIGRERLQDLADSRHFRKGEIRFGHLFRELFPPLRVFARFILQQISDLLQKFKRIHLDDGGQRTERIRHLPVGRYMPMLFRRMFA